MNDRLVLRCRLPEPGALRDKESAQRQKQSQPKTSQSDRQLQSQQFAEKLQQKLQGDDLRAVATAPAASAQPHTDHQSDIRYHKGSHAHFADESAGGLDDVHDEEGVTGRNESITAVRGVQAGPSSAQGTFWKSVDSGSDYRAVSGTLSLHIFLAY